MFVELRVLLEMSFELRNLPIGLLAGMDGALQFFTVQGNSFIVLFLDLEDVHQDHHLLLLLHVL